MFNLHYDAFAWIGPDKVDAHVTDPLSEIEPHVVHVMVDVESVLNVSAPDIDVANAAVKLLLER